MKAGCHVPNLVVPKLWGADRLLAEGGEAAKVANGTRIYEQTFYRRWAHRAAGRPRTPTAPKSANAQGGRRGSSNSPTSTW
jgi:hypothetical protein